jgi:fatty acid desaturase
MVLLKEDRHTAIKKRSQDKIRHFHSIHHIFPGINSDYYPMVQELLESHYPEDMNLIDAGEAWRLLRQTPRHYKNENTFTNWSGEKDVTCPLSHE